MKNTYFNICLRAYEKMSGVSDRIGNVIKDKKGAASVEYSMVTALIAVGVIGAAAIMFNGPMQEYFGEVVNKLSEFLSQ